MQNTLRTTGNLGKIVVLAILLLATVSLAATPPTMAPDELRRGMRGYGLTVFQGTSIDTFQVEILGVMKGALGPRMDMILARFAGGGLEHSGPVQGMSGSPIYVEDRLIGAFAYGWAYSKEPIGGITPIAPMLDVAQRPDAPVLQGYGQSIKLDGEYARRLGRRAAALEPLGIPLAISGFGPLARQVLRETFSPLGMELVDTPSGQTDAQLQTPFIPGAPLAVQLIRGDRSAAFIGTLTWTDGERFAGFGHPMLQLGATDLPATGAYIHQIIPRQVVSFKLGMPTRTVGALRQDRHAGIAGALGAAPDMLPVTIAVRGPGGDNTFRFEVLRHRDLSAALARAVLLSSIESTEKVFGDATLRLATRLAFTDGRILKRHQIYSGQTALLVAALDAVIPFDELQRNPFATLSVDALHFDLDIGESLTSARVAALRPSTPEPAAGQRIEVRIALQPYRANVEEIAIDLDLPQNLAPGPLVLRVGSGPYAEAWEAARSPDAFVPRDLDALLTLLTREAAANELVIELFRPGSGFTIDGRELPDLPPSAHAVLTAERSAGRLGLVQGEVLLRRTVDTDYVLAGEQSLELTVRKEP